MVVPGRVPRLLWVLTVAGVGIFLVSELVLRVYDAGWLWWVGALALPAGALSFAAFLGIETVRRLKRASRAT